MQYFLVGTSNEKLNKFIDEELDNNKCSAFQCDLSDKESIKELTKAINGKIDVIINNAGITKDNNAYVR